MTVDNVLSIVISVAAIVISLISIAMTR